MPDDTKKRVRILAAEVIEALSTVLAKRTPLDSKTLSEAFLDRPKVVSLLSEAESGGRGLGDDLSKKSKEHDELAEKHNKLLKDIRFAETQALEVEEVLKELAATLILFAQLQEEAALQAELGVLKDLLKRRIVPARIREAIRQLKALGFKLDTGAFSAAMAEADTELGGEDVQELVRDLLTAVVREFASYEDRELGEQARKVGRDIESDFTLDNSQPYVQSIIDLIFKFKERMREQRVELYRFSQEVMVHLEETERDLYKSMDADRERFETLETDFDLRVADDMVDIERSFEKDSLSLPQLRTTVLARIGAMRQRFREKRAEAERRIEMAETEKKSIQRRLMTVHQRYKAFSEKSQAMLQEMEKLKQISLTDPLTQVYNRRAYDAQIQATVTALKESALKAYGLVFFDVDEFKRFNTQYGHRAGDKVLSYVARMVRDGIRKEDFLARYGGDEFVLILPEVDLDTAAKIAEKLCSEIAAVEFKLFRDRDASVTITLSMGVSQGRTDDTPASVFSRANQALFAAKEAGRNQVQSERPA
jgi:diguanylate cyclase (GGDEF)-like protein